MKKIVDKPNHDIHSTYMNIIQGTDEVVVRDRFNSLLERMGVFIAENDLAGRVKISETILEQVVVAYFDDVNRLKDFHGIELVAETKIHAYTAFWLLRKKPLQIIEDFAQCEAINEKFVTIYLVDFMLREKYDVVLSGPSKEQYEEFVKTINYCFKYRRFDAQSIELVLLSFLAGVAVGSIPNRTS